MSNFLTKLTSAIGVATLVAVSTSASLVSAASEFYEYAQVLAENAVISTQSSEAGYRLSNNITRAEMAKVVANLGGIEAVELTGVFSDVDASLGDLAGYIEALADAGIVSVASKSYRPSANVTRAEAVKLILGATGETPSDVDGGYMDTEGLGDLAGYINRARENAVIAATTYFRPNASVTRGEAFKMAVVAADLVSTGVDPVDPVTPPTGTGTTGTGTVVAGALTVALEGAAMAQYVPQNASNVKVGTVKVTAGTSDVTVSSLTVNRSGLGNSAGLSISVAQNGMIVSESRSVNSSTQDAIVRLNNPVVIKAGASALFDVLASVSGDANSQHQFSLKAVGTTASVTGTPVTLGLLNTTSYTVSTAKVTQLLFNTVTSGKNDQSLGTVKFQAGTKDMTLSAFTLSKTAGVDLTRALANVSVLKNGVKVGTATVTSDKIYVTGLAMKVLRSDTVTFELRADITYVGDGGATDDITLDILDTTDLSAVEDLTGYATATDLAGANTSIIDLSTLDIVWTKKTSKSVTVAPGTTNVVLFDANVVSSASFDVTKFTVDGVAGLANTNTDSGETQEFTSLTLTVNGVDYDLLTTTQSSAGTYVFQGTSDKFRMDPGSTVNVKLVGNLSNSATTGVYSYNVQLDTVKNVSTGNSVSLTGKNITGDQVTVQAPTLLLKSSTKAPDSASKIYSNATNLEVGRFGAEAKAEDVTIREVTLTNVAGSGTDDFTKLVSGTNVKLVNVDDGSSVSATVTVATGSIKFTGMSIKVLKDTTSNYKVLVDTQGDLTTTFTATGGNNNLKFNVAVPSATSSSTSSITVSSYNTTKVYSVSVVPPGVTLVKKNANTFLMTITNKDADSDISLASISAQVRPVSVSNSSYEAFACIRDEGSSDKCGLAAVAGTVQAVPGAGVVFNTTVDLAGNTFPMSISKNSSITREIFVESSFVSPTDLEAEITALNYGVSETYSVIAK